MIIVLDSSALIAILENEPDARELMAALLAAEECVISAFTRFESEVVMLRRHGQDGMRTVTEFVARTEARVVPFDAALADAAAAAYARFGKGIDPRAKLNLGDCVSYALARSLDAPLLFKGGDFAATDISPALPPWP